MKKILIFLVLAAAVAGIYGYWMFTRTEPSLNDVKADLAVDVADFLKAYDADEDAANTQYLDKIVEVKGKVDQVRTDENGIVKISFASDDPMATVLAEMASTENEKALKISPDTEITIRGKCTGKLSDIVCINCVIK